MSEAPLAERLQQQPLESIELSERQVVEVEIESTATSCGYRVPALEFRQQRTRAERGRRSKVSRDCPDSGAEDRRANESRMDGIRRVVSGA